MTDTAIQVRGLGKEYRIGHQNRSTNIREAITSALTAPFRRMRQPLNPDGEESFWALKDVSFDVKRGEVVGVIGRNGAGKSTLLKILSRITEPTEGEAIINGRVGSLLEVGTGFHPELTGRENVYLNGAILGMKRGEIDKKFDEIVAFSEVEKFLDTPVKHYSSGMYMRLAFAVAAHLEPEILIVDEVLAVGDMAFQQKCLGKMETVADEGRTVIFVSHNMAAVTNLCDRVIWLNEGKVCQMGDTTKTVADYLFASTRLEAVWRRTTDPKGQKALLHSITIINPDGTLARTLAFDAPFNIELVYQTNEPLLGLAAAIRLKTQGNVCVLVTSEKDSAPVEAAPRPVGMYTATCQFPGGLFRPGTYLLNVGLFREGAEVYDFCENAVSFDISPEGCAIFDGRDGIITPSLEWTIHSAEKVRI